MLKLFSRLRRHPAIWFVSRGLMMTIAILGAFIVSSLTVDIGPWARSPAERYLSDQIQRPVHIGGMNVHLLPALLLGHLEVTGFTIESRRPSDRPFFTAEPLRA